MVSALNGQNGKVMGRCLPRHRGRGFVRFLSELEKEVPQGLDIK